MLSGKLGNFFEWLLKGSDEKIKLYELKDDDENVFRIGEPMFDFEKGKDMTYIERNGSPSYFEWKGNRDDTLESFIVSLKNIENLENKDNYLDDEKDSF